jgi:hypothetical protein
MKKMSTKAKAFNTKKANEGHDRKATRKRLAARLRHQTANYTYRPMQYAPAPQDPTIADVPVAEELADTDTVKL